MGAAKTQTPLMRQYLALKAEHDDAVLMFRLGDFYEMFYEDAVQVAKALDLTLTTRDKNKENPVPMCGVPHHTLRSYVAKLVERGHKVAICEQMEDPKRAKGIVHRAVTQVVTPGVILDMDHLEARKPNYLAAIWPHPRDSKRERNGRGQTQGHAEAPAQKQRAENRAGASAQALAFGLAFSDVSTGEFRVTVLADGDALKDELARITPRQILLPRAAAEQIKPLLPQSVSLAEAVDDTWFVQHGGYARLAAAVGEKKDHLAHLPAGGVPAATAVLAYLEKNLQSGRTPRLRIVAYAQSDFLVLDEATLANLEVFQTLMEGKRTGSLLGAVDLTITPMGGRALRRALAFPLQDIDHINRRLDAVEHLLEHPRARVEMGKLLKEIYDLERLGRRMAHQIATPKDLAALRRSLELMPELAHVLESIRPTPDGLNPGRDLALLDLRTDLLADVARTIAAALVDDPPASLKDGGVIRPGYNKELDTLVETARGGKDRILAIEEKERRATGISSLKVKYNKVFGYYIEVTKANLAAVPEHYTRKQTLVNSERFVTPELAEHESLVLEAEEKRLELEHTLFEALRQSLADDAERLVALARRVAMVDLLRAFGELAAGRDLVRPILSEEGILEIEEGRHPVVEQVRQSGTFVPNDTVLDPERQQVLIITGPNMAGKSTIIRQVAIIALLAHTGCFVPAKRATVGLVDRIFTRVGASDNLARGESTFLVEMKETANILRYATRRSLIILDEIGRGTSTFDGMSLAWAVAEYLHDRIGAKTLFATHYHELCELARVKKKVKNFAVMVREWRDEIVFLHKLTPGGVNRSYGIQVARLAGLPETVIKRALQILEDLERGEDLRVPGAVDVQLDLFSSTPAGRALKRRQGPPASANPPGAAETTAGTPVGVLPENVQAVVTALEDQAPDDLSPRQAHALLYTLSELLAEGPSESAKEPVDD
jgi:DNA mismatch repair protein MutS